MSCHAVPCDDHATPPPAGAGLGPGADPFPGPSAEQLLAQIRGENARRQQLPEQPPTRLDAGEVKRLEKAARRAATSAAKAHAKAVALAQQLGRPLHDLTNDLPMGGGNFGGADGGIPLGPPPILWALELGVTLTERGSLRSIVRLRHSSLAPCPSVQG